MFLQNLGSFEADLTVALIGSNVPVVIVKDRKAAALEISGRRTQKRGGTFAPDWIVEATITITNIESGVVIDAFTVSADSVGKVARAAAQRLQDRMVIPFPPPVPARATDPVRDPRSPCLPGSSSKAISIALPTSSR